nr:MULTISPECIES: RHS repeat-associated core domain-containing protein [unclassified Streptococcus]
MAGNKLTSTEEVDGKEEKTTYTYDDNNRLTKLENKDGTTTYSYDRNGNRISSKKNDEQLDYIYDTENRLLAVKDKQGLLLAALYDGDDNRVFTASRKEGRHTYPLFKREEKKKSPYTAEHSLFWYGFSQNVLQSLSTLPQTVGTIWHDIFDDVSTAYHQKVAKDRANSEGLVINPPDLGNLPGEGDVTYASQVKEVLIPYTTREDTFNYYEERNYVNDVNRAHTEVLQTYDRELNAKETYTYGQGRTSYLNHETGDHYHYLSNQAGSVTGLTKEGVAVASSSYSLYGLTKQSTDETGNPFAYNGEARDITGLDYLRARYYDSRAGTFLTEDSYAGQATDPLSQNRYAYVHNNPVNYTDPSGHFWNKLWKGAKKFGNNLWNGAKKLYHKAERFVGNLSNAGQNLASHSLNKLTEFISGGSRGGSQIQPARSFTRPSIGSQPHSTYDWVTGKAYQPHYTAVNRWQEARVSGLSTHHWGTSQTREAQNIDRNWTKALEETIRHVCNPRTTKARDKGSTPKPISFGGGGVASWEGPSGSSSRYQPNVSAPSKGNNSSTKGINSSNYGVNLGGVASWDGTAGSSSRYQPKSTSKPKELTEKEIAARRAEGKKLLKILGGELSGWYSAKRLWTGKDPVTGETANRWFAAGELGFDLASYMILFAKAGKAIKAAQTAGKVIDTIDNVSDASKALKAVDTVDDTKDALKVAEAVDDVSDVSKGYTPPKGGGGTTSTIKIGDKTINFGHGGRHLEGTGYTVPDISKAIADDLISNPLKIGEYRVKDIVIDGTVFRYKAKALDNNLINVGTFYPISK